MHVCICIYAYMHVHICITKLNPANRIEKIAAQGEMAEVPALFGWRRELFGQEALNLRSGKLALVINGQNLELVEFEDE